jgi:hypothetical protein
MDADGLRLVLAGDPGRDEAHRCLQLLRLVTDGPALPFVLASRTDADRSVVLTGGRRVRGVSLQQRCLRRWPAGLPPPPAKMHDPRRLRRRAGHQG